MIVTGTLCKLNLANWCCMDKKMKSLVTGHSLPFLKPSPEITTPTHAPQTLQTSTTKAMALQTFRFLPFSDGSSLDVKATATRGAFNEILVFRGRRNLVAKCVCNYALYVS